MARTLLLLLSLLIALPLVGCSDNWGDGAESSADALSETSTAEPAVKGAVASLKAAIEDDAKVDARLSHALARIGPMITPEQHRSYARAFEQLPDVKATRASYHNAAKALDDELTKLLATDATTAQVMAGLKQRKSNGRAIVEVVVFGPRDLFDAYALLATTPYALRALQFGQRLIDEDPRLANVRASQEDVAERIMMPGLPEAYLDQLVRLGSSEAAVRQLKSVLGQSSRLRSLAGWLGSHLPKDTSDPMMNRIAIGGKNIADALHTVAAIMVIWELGVDLSRGDIDSALQTLVASGPSAVAGVAHAVSLLRRLLIGAPTTEIADKVVAVAGRFGQGIAVVISVFALINDAGKWNESLDAKVRVAADAVAVGAAVLMLVSTGPVGPILGGIAIGIHFFADWLEGRALEEQERRDITACLAAAGLPQPVIDTMLAADATSVKTLSEEVGLDGASLQWLLTTDDWSVIGHPLALPLHFTGLLIVKEIFGLDGAKTAALLRAVVGMESSPEKRRFMVDQFMRVLEFGQGFDGFMSKSSALAWIDREINESLVMPTDAAAKATWQRALRNGRTFLATAR